MATRMIQPTQALFGGRPAAGGSPSLRRSRSASASSSSDRRSVAGVHEFGRRRSRPSDAFELGGDLIESRAGIPCAVGGGALLLTLGSVRHALTVPRADRMRTSAAVERQASLTH